MTTTSCRICLGDHPVGDYCPDPQIRRAAYAEAARDKVRAAKARREGRTCSHDGTIGKCQECDR